MQHVNEQRSLGELFTELTQETGTLVRKEVQLAKVELTGKAKVAAKDAAGIGVGAGIAIAGALTLLAAVVLLLGTVIPLWLSALIVGAVVTAVGVVLAKKALRALQGVDPVPRQTIKTLQENKQWLTEQASR